MRKILKLMSVLLAAVVCGCSDSDFHGNGNDPVKTVTKSIRGTVEKGPMVRGTQIDMRTLDVGLNPNGRSYTALIEDNAGTFDFGTLNLETQYAKLTADGYFYNEVSGRLSDSPIKLDAVVDLTQNSMVNVNILTHLKKQRIVRLVTNGGKSLKEANAIAQKELLSAFGYGNLSLADASQFSIAGNNEASAVLVAISSLILADRSEAEVVEYLSVLSSELANKGTFSKATMQQIYQDRNYLNSQLDDVTLNVCNRYSELGYDIVMKDLAYYFDWNENGIAGDELEYGVPKMSQTVIEVPAEGGSYNVDILSDKPYYIEIPEHLKDGALLEPDNDNREDFWNSDLYEGGYDVADMTLSKSMTGKTITLTVGQSQAHAVQHDSVVIYNARGQKVAAIQVRQEGKTLTDMKTPNLGKMGMAAFSNVLNSLRNAYSAMLQREQSFVNSTSLDYPVINADDYGIRTAWTGLYSAIKNLTMIKAIDDTMYGVYQDYCNTWLAIAYTVLVSYWDAVPYIINAIPVEESMRMPRTDKRSVIDNLLNLTEAPMSKFDEKRINITDINDMFFLSKDAVRMVRAKLLMEKGDYAKALPLLKTVINSYRYSLTTSDRVEYAHNDESVLSLLLDNSTRATSVHYGVCPIFDLKDAYMDAAECAYHADGGTESQYLKAVDDAKKLKAESVSGPIAVETIRKQMATPYQIPCLRRFGHDNSILPISGSYWYQIVWPIPYREIMSNPNITQNPGY